MYQYNPNINEPQPYDNNNQEYYNPDNNNTVDTNDYNLNFNNHDVNQDINVNQDNLMSNKGTIEDINSTIDQVSGLQMNNLENKNGIQNTEFNNTGTIYTKDNVPKTEVIF